MYLDLSGAALREWFKMCSPPLVSDALQFGFHLTASLRSTHHSVLSDQRYKRERQIKVKDAVTWANTLFQLEVGEIAYNHEKS